MKCKLQTQKKEHFQGLYQSDYEHDACGVGMVVNIHGGKSHELVDNALKVLENMEHRGAETRDKTGDGAGIMVQIPHEFILLQGIPVPEKGKYGTGLVFLPKDEKAQHDGGHFQMKDYHVLSWDDIENGPVTDHGVILDVKDVPWAEKQMWDNDCVEKNGKYYLIFSAKDYNGVFHLGVAVADKPEGPFTPQAMPIRGSFSIDPCVFKDDDGQIYTYFGGLWGGQLQWYRPIQHIKPEKPSERINPISPAGSVDVGPAPDKKTQLFAHADAPALPSCVVRMSDDVMQFAEAPRPVIILDKNGEPLKAGDPHRFFEASWMHKYNGKYYFSYSTGDSHFLCYAIGDNPYGPFTYQGVILDPVVGWTTHHSIVEFKGQWYLCYHDCVPSNDITHLRSLKVQQLFYNEDGTIKKVVNE